ncbi:E3 ubiquitin-protein ligase msl-2 isoform X2 [Drosophila innubila]|nr:E3 ubiquitin-protein ligase msl-2 isoform X2 [Drosophila innubila]
MEAQTVYIKVWRLSLKSTSMMSKRRVQELNAGLGELRQLLSCVVCRELLKDPYEPARRRCGHHVCRLCLRGRKRLKPSCTQCGDCSDFKTYKENKSMAWQVLCYRTLCRHLQNSLLYSQLYGHRLCNDSNYNAGSTPRIELPDESTQWFIQEGANYIDMCDTFLPQPDTLSLPSYISSLPAETPPTTAATTPELPYEQHMPEQLSITDIELEGAATGDQAHFAHPLPLMPSSARMLSHTHIAPQPQMILPAAQPIITAGYPSWTDQVDLSGAFPMPATNYTTYVMHSGEPTIGQVVQISPELPQTPLEPVTASTSTAASFKRRHADLLADDVEQTSSFVVPAPTRMSLRNQKATIISSVQVKPPSVPTAVAASIAVPAPIAMPAPVAVAASKAKATPVTVAASKAKPTPVPVAAAKAAAIPKTPTTLKTVTASKAAATPKPTAPLKATATPKPVTAPKLTGTPKVATTVKPVATPVVAIEPTVVSTAAVAVKTTSARAVKTAPVRSAVQKAKPMEKRSCRCGTSSAPGLMTCRNGRCACYSMGYKCVDCKCNGCKNPHTYSGGETSDEEDEQMETDVIADTEETTTTAAALDATVESVTPSGAVQPGYTLVPLENLQQSQHPLVLIQNERGEFQGFNLFNGTEPVHPAQVGYQRIPLQSNDGNSSIPEFAYVLPTTTVQTAPPPQPASPLPPPPIEQPFKKFKRATNMEKNCTLPSYSRIESVDELLGGNSKSKASSGDALATDKAHLLFEDIMSGSDDL